MDSKYRFRTDEEIKASMLEEIEPRVLDFAGTFVNDLLSPVSIELAQADIELAVLQEKMYAENLEGEELDRRAKEWANIDRKEATKASGYITFVGEEGTTISAGEIVSSAKADYVVLEDITLENGTGKALVECVETGTIGNALPRTILDTDIAGVNEIYNEKAFINGYEEETDEELYDRYQLVIKYPGTSGNKYHYEQWAKEVDGVGAVKVEPLWKGPGTVKVIIIDRNRGTADDELINETYKHIEEKRPVGADVTVDTGNPKNINIKAKVKLADGHNIRNVRDLFLKSLEDYRQKVTFEESYLSYAKVGNILLSTNGVLDYEELKINDKVANVELEYDDIPFFSNIQLDVI